MVGNAQGVDMSSYDETLQKYKNDIINTATDKKVHVQTSRAGSGASSVNPEEIRNDISKRLESLFDPFIGMPEPGDYQPMIEQLDKAMRCLSPGGSGNKDLDKVKLKVNPPANAQLDMVSAAATNLLNGWSGAAASEFNNNFARKFNSASTNHFTLLLAMQSTMSAQKSMWEQARSNIDDTVKKTIEAIDSVSVYCPWPGSMTFSFSVATAVGSLASLGPGSLLAGVMTAIGAVGGAATEGAKELEGEATSVDGVLNALVKGVQTLVGDVLEAEQKIAGGLTEFTKKIEDPATKADFVLPRPELAKMRGDTDELTSSTGLGKPKG